MDKEETKKIKREISIGEERGDQRIEFSKEELEATREKDGLLGGEEIVAEQLRKEIEAMELDETLKEEAKRKAEKIEFLGEQQKIEHLLEIAKDKGVLFAVKVADNMKDPNILDTFHDTLALLIQKGKKFTK